MDALKLIWESLRIEYIENRGNLIYVSLLLVLLYLANIFKVF